VVVETFDFSLLLFVLANRMRNRLSVILSLLHKHSFAALRMVSQYISNLCKFTGRESLASGKFTTKYNTTPKYQMALASEGQCSGGRDVSKNVDLKQLSSINGVNPHSVNFHFPS